MIQLPRQLEVDTREFRDLRAEMEKNAKQFLIRLDGEPQKYVLAYDQDKGVLTRYKMRDGRPLIEDDAFVTEIVNGRVEVSLEDASG